jgi:hypothetical protein
MADPNQIGKRGESIFSAKISKGFLLDPSFLGDKYPAVDFIIDVNSNGQKIFFFVSVKTTSKPKYSPKTNRLKIHVNKEQLRRLKKFKIPTYIVGLDEKRETAYIVSVDGITSKTISSIPTKFSIGNKKNIITLVDEVKDYWKNLSTRKKIISKFL